MRSRNEFLFPQPAPPSTSTRSTALITLSLQALPRPILQPHHVIGFCYPVGTAISFVSWQHFYDYISRRRVLQTLRVRKSIDIQSPLQKGQPGRIVPPVPLRYKCMKYVLKS